MVAATMRPSGDPGQEVAHRMDTTPLPASPLEGAGNGPLENKNLQPTTPHKSTGGRSGGTDRESPVVVMVGIIADSQRLRRRQVEFESAFKRLGDLPERTIQELKSTNLYRGKGHWSPPTPTSPEPTGGSSGPPTPWSASTGRSSGAVA